MQDLDKFKNEMNLSGKNVYVGHRYVPKIMGDWDNTQIYEPLSIVQYQGNSFTSRQYVPSGIEITNEDYWASTGNYNAQLEFYRQEVSNVNSEVANARNGEANLKARLDKDKQEVTANLAQIATVVADDTQNFLDDLVDGSTVKFKREKYDLYGQVLILRNKENIVLDLTGTHFKQHFHGHGVLEIENCKNITIIGGVIEGSGMVEAMATTIINALPEFIAPHTHWFLALFSVPLMMVLGTDAFYFALLPIVIGIVEPFGISASTVAATFLITGTYGTYISPTVAANYVGVSLAGTTIGEHIKANLPIMWATSIITLIAATLLGVVQF